MMKNRILILFLIFFLGLFFSCDIDPTRKKKDRIKLIEELTKLKTDSLKRELDSLCAISIEENFDILVDSMVEVRVEKIKEKMKAY